MEIPNNFYFCGEYYNTNVWIYDTVKRTLAYGKSPVQSDELYQANGVVYLEANLKINHLRILMAIISHLQDAFRQKVARPGKSSRIPVQPVPEVLEIPMADFHLGPSNGMRLRSCLEELRHTRITFPTESVYLLNTFPGLIEEYDFPAYGKTVRIRLPEQLVHRLLLTEGGFFHYSHAGALSLSNKYTVRLYWLICSWRNRGGFVLPVDTLRKMLQLGRAYDKFGNIVSRVLAPAQATLQAHFPIWFLYRVYEHEGRRLLAFKIKVRLDAREQERLRREAWDTCFHLLGQAGISLLILEAIFSRVEAEDLKPFVTKLADVLLYIRQHRDIHDPARYLRTALQSWLDDWSVRYGD